MEIDGTVPARSILANVAEYMRHVLVYNGYLGMHNMGHRGLSPFQGHFLHATSIISKHHIHVAIVAVYPDQLNVPFTCFMVQVKLSLLH